MTEAVVEIVSTRVIEVAVETGFVPEVNLGVMGPKGADGAAASSVRYDVTVPTGTWTYSHGLGRVPLAQVYLASGELVIADVDATTATITVTFAQPTAGYVILF